MKWFILSFACAAAFSFADLLQKIALNRDDRVMAVAWYRFALMAVGVIILQAFLPLPEVRSRFWPWLIVMVPLEIIAFMLFVTAVSLSPLSLTIPFLAFTPVFTILTGWLFVGDRVTGWGIAGVILVSLGAYLLNARDVLQGGWRGPIRAVARERGSVLAIVTAIIWAVTSAGGKRMILLSSPLYFASTYFAVAALLFLPVAVLHTGRSFKEFIRWRPIYLPMGLAAFLGIFFHVTAIAIAPVSYMIAVKRLSLILAILWGRLFLKEERIGERLLGGFVMLGGVFMIVLGG